MVLIPLVSPRNSATSTSFLVCIVLPPILYITKFKKKLSPSSPAKENKEKKERRVHFNRLLVETVGLIPYLYRVYIPSVRSV